MQVDIFIVDTGSGRSFSIVRTHRAVGKDVFGDSSGMSSNVLAFVGSIHIAVVAGTVVALGLFELGCAETVGLLTGHENGRIALFRISTLPSASTTGTPSPGGHVGHLVWTSVLHREPVTSIALGIGASRTVTTPCHARPSWIVAWTAAADHRIGRIDIKMTDEPGTLDNDAAECTESASTTGRNSGPWAHPSSPAVAVTCSTYRTLHPGRAALAVRYDGRLLASMGWDAVVRLYDARADDHVSKTGRDALAKLRELGALALQSHGATDHNSTALAFACVANGSSTEDSPGRGLLAAGGKDGRVCLWDVYPPQHD